MLLHDTEHWRFRIRMASVLCLIVFWCAVFYCVVFLFAAVLNLAKARDAQDRVGAAGLLISALMIAGIAVL